MRVREFMSSPVFCVRPDDDLVHARKELIRHHVSHLAVVDDQGAPVGVLSLSDLAFNSRHKENPPRANLALPARRRPAARPLVAAVASRDPVTLAPGMSAEEAARVMARRDLSFLPVVEAREVVGCVAAVDVLDALGPPTRGSAQAKGLMRPLLPAVPRHASAEHILRLMDSEGVREVAVLEGQAFITDRPAPSRDDILDGVHRGRESARWGIAGRVSLQSLVSSAWFDEHRAGGWPGPKRIVEARKATHAGRKQLRHVELVDAVAEDMMLREVPALHGEDDVAAAARVFVQTGASGLPVLADGAREPGYLDRAEVLRHLVDHLPEGPRPGRAARRASAG